MTARLKKQDIHVALEYTCILWKFYDIPFWIFNLEKNIHKYGDSH